jgi:hypothetical protein
VALGDGVFSKQNQAYKTQLGRAQRRAMHQAVKSRMPELGDVGPRLRWLLRASSHSAIFSTGIKSSTPHEEPPTSLPEVLVHSALKTQT